MTNLIRRGVAASPLGEDEAWNTSVTLFWRIKRWPGHPRGWRWNVGKDVREKRGDLWPGVTVAGVRVCIVPSRYGGWLRAGSVETPTMKLGCIPADDQTAVCARGPCNRTRV